MFTNATILALYVQARRDDDLRPRRGAPRRARGFGLRSLFGALAPRRAPVATPLTPQPR
jgi:hypothetical protein